MNSLPSELSLSNSSFTPPVPSNKRNRPNLFFSRRNRQFPIRCRIEKIISSRGRGERDTFLLRASLFLRRDGIYIYVYIQETRTPKTTPTYLPTLGVVGLSSVATIRRRRGEEVGSSGCRKQAAAIMRDGRDRVRSIFSISREWSPYYSTARRPWRVQLGYSIRGGRGTGLRLESTLPLSLPPISLSYSSLFLSLSLSVVSQAGSLLVKIQFVAAHLMENKKTGGR